MIRPTVTRLSARTANLLFQVGHLFGYLCLCFLPTRCFFGLFLLTDRTRFVRNLSKPKTMKSLNKHQAAKLLKHVSRYGLLIIGLITFSFSLISGAEGNNILSIVKNSPNTIPWVILLALTLLSFKRELTGALAILIFGAILFFLFNSGPNFFLVSFILSLIIPTFGLMLLMSWFIERKESAKPE